MLIRMKIMSDGAYVNFARGGNSFFNPPVLAVSANHQKYTLKYFMKAADKVR